MLGKGDVDPVAVGLALMLGRSESWAAGLETCMRDFHVAQKEEQMLWWIAQVRGGHKPRAWHVFVGQWSSVEEQCGAGRGLLGQGKA